MTTWIVEGMWSPDYYYQKDSHSCGPIALNRFASELHKIYQHLEEEGEYIGGEIDAPILNRIKTPEELKENNSENAAELYQVLLATKRNAFDIEEGGDDDGIDNQFVMEKPTIIELDVDENSEEKSRVTSQNEDKAEEDLHADNEVQALNVSSADTRIAGRPQSRVTSQNEDKALEGLQALGLSWADTPRARRPQTLEKTLASKRKIQDWEVSKRRKKLRETAMQNSCHAGIRCREPLVPMVLEGENKNASECSTCK
jgi:hypothetical protein